MTDDVIHLLKQLKADLDDHSSGLAAYDVPELDQRACGAIAAAIGRVLNSKDSVISNKLEELSRQVQALYDEEVRKYSEVEASERTRGRYEAFSDVIDLIQDLRESASA